MKRGLPAMKPGTTKAQPAAAAQVTMTAPVKGRRRRRTARSAIKRGEPVHRGDRAEVDMKQAEVARGNAADTFELESKQRHASHDP